MYVPSEYHRHSLSCSLYKRTFDWYTLECVYQHVKRNCSQIGIIFILIRFDAKSFMELIILRKREHFPIKILILFNPNA